MSGLAAVRLRLFWDGSAGRQAGTRQGLMGQALATRQLGRERDEAASAVALIVGGVPGCMVQGDCRQRVGWPAGGAQQAEGTHSQQEQGKGTAKHMGQG